MKRWIIRSFFIGLLLLCVGGWMGSYVYEVAILRSPPLEAHPTRDITYLAGNHYQADCNWGQIQLWRWFGEILQGVNYSEAKIIWSVRAVAAHSPQPDPRLVPLTYYGGNHHFVGFEIRWNAMDAVEMVAIPFWFPTSIAAALLWLVWRKTRPKAHGRAFPVELEKTTGER